MANIMTRERDVGTTRPAQSRSTGIFQTLLRSPFPELSIVRDLVNAVSPGASDSLGFVPKIELCEQDGNYLVDMALPGFKKDDIDIEVSGNEITVSGKYQRTENDRKTRYSEMLQSSFSRTIALPQDISADKVTASFENGMLHVCAPPVAAITAKRVTIKGEA